MELSTKIANRFREVLLNGRWVTNTNFKEQLTNTTLEQATHQISSINTIALITFHINYYIAGVNHFFETGKLEISDKYSFDAPPINSEEDWRNLTNELFTNSEKFAAHVERMSNEKLEDVFFDEKYGSYLRNIEGMIEHCYYHLGQVTMIRKMLLEQKIGV